MSSKVQACSVKKPFWRHTRCIICPPRGRMPYSYIMYMCSWDLTPIYFTYSLEGANSFPRHFCFTFALEVLTPSSIRPYPLNCDSLLEVNAHLCLWGPDSLLKVSFWPWGPYSLLKVPLTSRSTPFSKSSPPYPWGLDSILEARFSLKVLTPSLRWIPTCVSEVLTPSSAHIYLRGSDSLLELFFALEALTPSSSCHCLWGPNFLLDTLLHAIPDSLLNAVPWLGSFSLLDASRR